MIVGIGTDIVEIEKLRLAMVRRGDRLRNRAFTEGEIAYCEERASRYQHYAIGTGWRDGVGWHDAEVKNEMSGKPILILSGRALEIALQMGARHFWLSLSHTDLYAVAQVILEGS